MNSKGDIKFISKTDYFRKPRTWIVRLVQFSIAVLVLYLVDLSELTNGTQLLYVCGSLLAIGFVMVPVNELGFDKDNLYFIKKSFIPFLNRTRSYPISSIKRIGYYSMSGVAGLAALFVPVTNVFRIEFTFQDNSSKSDDLFIHKKDLQKIVSEVRQLASKGIPNSH